MTRNDDKTFRATIAPGVQPLNFNMDVDINEFYCLFKGGGGVSKRLDGIISCKKDKTSSWHLIEFLVGSNIGSAV